MPSSFVITSPPDGYSWPSTTSVPVGRLQARLRGRRAGAHGGDRDARHGAELLGDRIRNRVDADAEVGVLDRAGLDQLVGDQASPCSQGREADAVVPADVALDLRVDADHLALRSSSGPPELPWLIAASVWIASAIA